MGAETGTTLTLVWIHKLVYCVSAYHDQPRPPRRLALTVETKSSHLQQRAMFWVNTSNMQESKDASVGMI